MSFASKIERIGKPIRVLVRGETSENEFGNPEYGYTEEWETYAIRTYPNRNTEQQGSAGETVTDQPVFLIPKGHELPDLPAEGDHIRYPSNDGQEYELEAPTHYDHHVEFFGQSTDV